MNEHHHFFFYFKVKTCNHAQHCCHAHTPATARPEPTPRKLPQCDRHFCFAFMTMHKIVHTLHIIQFCFLYLYILKHGAVQYLLFMNNVFYSTFSMSVCVMTILNSRNNFHSHVPISRYAVACHSACIMLAT